MAPLSGFRLWAAAVVIAGANFMVVLDMTIANVSVPNIAGSLGATIDWLVKRAIWFGSHIYLSNGVVRTVFNLLWSSDIVIDAGRRAGVAGSCRWPLDAALSNLAVADIP